MPYEGLDPFITEDDLSAYIGRDVTEDDMATIAVEAACTLLRNSAGQQLDLQEDEEVLVDGSGTDTILLPELPVVDVSEVSYVSVVPDTLIELEAETDYLVDRRNGALVRRSSTTFWSEGRGKYKVTYSHGFETIPADLRALALTVAARLYEQGVIKQETVGGYSATFAANDPVGLTRNELNLIAKYRPARSAATYEA